VRPAPGRGACITLLAAMLANAGNALAASPPASQVQLSARDQQRLSGLACTPIGSGGVDAVQARRQGAGETVAEVRCQPHATSYSVPVARLASCAGSAGRWQCAATGVESFTIRCGEAVITLNKDCWNGGCRFFIPFALNY
jgi:hypothetical protein